MIVKIIYIFIKVSYSKVDILSLEESWKFFVFVKKLLSELSFKQRRQTC